MYTPFKSDLINKANLSSIILIFTKSEQAKKKYRGMFDSQKVRRHDKFRKTLSQH